MTITSYVFRPIYSPHQASHESENKIEYSQLHGKFEVSNLYQYIVI